MKFYGNGAVWDKEKDTYLCKFNKQGFFETTDQRISNILLDLGYQSDSEIAYTIEEKDLPSEFVGVDLTDEHIRALAKEHKVKSWHVKSIETLTEELKELELI